VNLVKASRSLRMKAADDEHVEGQSARTPPFLHEQRTSTLDGLRENSLGYLVSGGTVERKARFARFPIVAQVARRFNARAGEARNESRRHAGIKAPLRHPSLVESHHCNTSERSVGSARDEAERSACSAGFISEPESRGSEEKGSKWSVARARHKTFEAVDAFKLGMFYEPLAPDPAEPKSPTNESKEHDSDGLGGGGLIFDPLGHELDLAASLDAMESRGRPPTVSQSASSQPGDATRNRGESSEGKRRKKRHSHQQRRELAFAPPAPAVLATQDSKRPSISQAAAQTAFAAG